MKTNQESFLDGANENESDDENSDDENLIGHDSEDEVRPSKRQRSPSRDSDLSESSAIGKK